MVSKEDIERLLNPHLNRLLQVAEVGMPPSQFQAYRKFALDELGNNGFGKELEKLLGSKTARHGTGRDTLRKEGGAS
jgi:hypothetical protein